MTEYKPKVQPDERPKLRAYLDISRPIDFHFDNLMDDLEHAEACLAERDAEIERLKAELAIRCRHPRLQGFTACADAMKHLDNNQPQGPSVYEL